MATDKNRNPLPKGISYRPNEGRYMGRFKYHYEEYTVYGKTLNETQRKLEDLKYQIMHGTYFKENTVTFDAWFDTWINDFKKPMVKAGTVEVYRQNYNAYIKKAFGGKQMRDIRTSHIQRFYNVMADNYSHNTIEICRAILNGMFSSAIKNELLQRNPVSNATLPKDNRRHTANVLAESEQKLFMKYAQNTRYAPIYELALSTGMRSGELRGLQWNDIDFTSGTIHVTHTLVYQDGKNRLDTPKTRSSERDIPMLDNVHILLRKQRKTQMEDRLLMGQLWTPVPGLENLVFTNRYGHPISRNRFKRSIEKIVSDIRADGISFPHTTPHTFRHTFATRCIERGMPPKVLQTILGHSDLATTMDTYAHVLPNTKANEMKRLNGLF